jgi:hypothetical protein
MKEWMREPLWATAAARSVWKSRVAHIAQMWLAVERASVLEGIRSSALTTVNPEGLAPLSAWAASHGLAITVLASEPLGDGYTSAVPLTGKLGLRVAVFGGAVSGTAWQDAWGDADEVGRLLGFPECCRSFFEREWGPRIDMTVPMARGATAVAGPVETNVLLRQLGLRCVPHLPCAFDCARSVELGREMLSVFRKLDADAASWLEEALSWEVLWTALHGACEVTTFGDGGNPILKFAASTDYSAKRLALRWRRQDASS